MQIPPVVQTEFDRLCTRCRALYPPFTDPELVIKTNGQAAGWAREREGTYTIDLNQTYLISNAADMLLDTLPHEMAHVLVMQRYNNAVCGTGSRARPHGVEWIAMFGALTGRVPTRLHDYERVKVAQKKSQETMTALAERVLRELEE